MTDIESGGDDNKDKANKQKQLHDSLSHSSKGINNSNEMINRKIYMVNTINDLFKIGKHLWSDQELTIFFHPLGNCHFFLELFHLIFMIY